MKAKVQQLEKQVEQLLALQVCTSCNENRRTVLSLPCCHFVLCERCCMQEQKRKVTRCLECDAPVQKFVHGVKMGDEADIYEEGGAVSDDDEEY